MSLDNEYLTPTTLFFTEGVSAARFWRWEITRRPTTNPVVVPTPIFASAPTPVNPAVLVTRVTFEINPGEVGVEVHSLRRL